MNQLQKRVCRSISSALWKQKKDNLNNTSSYFKFSGRPSIVDWSFLNLNSWTWQWQRIYICKTFFPTAVYSGQLELSLVFKMVLYSPQFTCQYLIEESIYLLSPWKLKHSLCQIICFRSLLVEVLFIVFFYCLCEYAALLSIYLIFIFYIWLRNVAVNRYIKIQIHFCCTIWPLWEKEISFCIVLLMWEKHP